MRSEIAKPETANGQNGYNKNDRVKRVSSTDRYIIDLYFCSGINVTDEMEEKMMADPVIRRSAYMPAKE